MKNKELIKNINDSNLSQTDKTELNEILNQQTPNLDLFVKTLSRIYKAKSIIFKLFDIDSDDT